MILSRTPFRISFFGGGTDYPVWFREHGGAVLSTTIDKYCYINCRYLPPFFEHKHRIVYSFIEMVKDIEEIKHPAVKAVFSFMEIEDGLEIHHDGDLPARTGLGSSSSFTVGLLHSLYALKGVMPTKMRLANEAIHIEQEIIRENVGSQDQVSAAFGGFNHIRFMKDGSLQISPVILPIERLRLLKDHLMFYFTGFSRYASEIAKKQVEITPKKKMELSYMYQMVQEAIDILSNARTDIGEFGKLLNESWKIKRSLTEDITNGHIDAIYEAAMRAGALGGKLLGAGGGGFMVIFARPQEQPAIAEKLKDLLLVPFDFETSGSSIVVYQPDGFH